MAELNDRLGDRLLFIEPSHRWDVLMRSRNHPMHAMLAGCEYVYIGCTTTEMVAEVVTAL